VNALTQNNERGFKMTDELRRVFPSYYCPHCKEQLSFHPEAGIAYCKECDSTIGDWETLTEEEIEEENFNNGPFGVGA